MSSNLIIAGTGHRPKYCPCKYKNNHPWLIALKTNLKDYLYKTALIEEDYNIIVRAGGAIGWDTWLAQVALELDLTLHLYLPFKDQGKEWPSDSRKEYERIKGEADKIIYTSENYHLKAFFDRDLAMITGADKVVSLLDPKVNSGGTFYTVGEAKKLGIDIINFWENLDENATK